MVIIPIMFKEEIELLNLIYELQCVYEGMFSLEVAFWWEKHQTEGDNKMLSKISLHCTVLYLVFTVSAANLKAVSLNILSVWIAFPMNVLDLLNEVELTKGMMSPVIY